MKKKTNIKTMIRQIVREEVAMAIQEVITELKQPTRQVSKPKPKKKIVEKKQYTKNSILNEVMNETAHEEEWKTMGGGTKTSDDMGSVMAQSYGDLMNGNGSINSDSMVTSLGGDPSQIPKEVKDNIFKKDYRKLMKAVEKKSNTTRG